MSALQAAVAYIGLSAALLMGLKAYVGYVRTREKIMDGHGENTEMQRAIRVQGNAVEDVPIILVGILGLGAIGAPVWLIHLLGISLLTARLLHAIGLARTGGFSLGRMIGTIGTVLVMLVTVASCLWLAFIG